MTRTLVVWACGWSSLAFAAEPAPDVVQDAVQLEQLIAEVRQVVPTGWRYRFSIGELYLRSTRPALEITSAKALPVEYLGPGRPVFGHTEPKKVKLWLALMAYQSPAEYAAARERNARLESERLAFFERHLKAVSHTTKGELPPHPISFEPRSPTETLLVRQYALVWLATEPEQLPTHYYGRLSMWYYPNSFAIHDAEGARQYEELVKGLAGILTAYEPKDEEDAAIVSGKPAGR